MEFVNPTDDQIRAILSRPTTVAVMGCSDNPDRDIVAHRDVAAGEGLSRHPGKSAAQARCA